MPRMQEAIHRRNLEKGCQIYFSRVPLPPQRGLGYSDFGIHGPTGPLGDLWNGQHLLLKKFA